MEQKKLPADPSATILGIISLVLIFIGCCCVFGVPISLILSIIGLVSANKSLRAYRYNAENYYPQSRSNVYTAKVINVIALIISVLYSLVFVLYFFIHGTFIFSEFFDEPLIQQYHYEDDYHYDDSEEQETYEDDYHYDDSDEQKTYQDEDEEDFLYPYGA